MKLIINLIGNKGAGKDFAYSILKNEGFNTSVKRYAFADKIKEEFISVYNYCIFKEEDKLNLEKLEANKELYRVGLQKHGDIQRSKNKMYFIDKTIHQIFNDFCKDKVEVAVVTDCRFETEKYELNKFASLSGIKIINIKIQGNEVTDNHISEQELKNMTADITVVNDYTDNFKDVLLLKIFNYLTLN